MHYGLPCLMILSRQTLPFVTKLNIDISKGAYIISKENKKAKYTIIATGSEVALALDVQKILLEKKIDVRVVSMPCVELFDGLSKKEQQKILGNTKDKCIVLEMLSSIGWYKYADTVFGIDSFGTSAPAKDVIKHFGFEAAPIADKIIKIK
mgnify:CR=1 FL=1